MSKFPVVVDCLPHSAPTLALTCALQIFVQGYIPKTVWWCTDYEQGGPVRDSETQSLHILLFPSHPLSSWLRHWWGTFWGPDLLIGASLHEFGACCRRATQYLCIMLVAEVRSSVNGSNTHPIPNRVGQMVYLSQIRNYSGKLGLWSCI